MLQINKLEIGKDTCEVVLRWSHPTVDSHLITDYIVWIYSMHNNFWFFDKMVSLGIETEYTTSCSLHPGRLYEFNIYQNVLLTDPDETILLYSTGRLIITGMDCFFRFHILGFG